MEDPVEDDANIEPFTKLGHSFIAAVFNLPETCRHCFETVWNVGLGLSEPVTYFCEICHFAIHQECLPQLLSPCPARIPHFMDHVPHCWSQPRLFNDASCNLCQLRLAESLSVVCEACEFYCHLLCLPFTDCCRKRSFVTASTPNPSSLGEEHEWQEANLDEDAICTHCHKNCSSSADVDFFTGVRCLWCQEKAHINCFQRLAHQRCHFGSLCRIYLPPEAVEVPVHASDTLQLALFGYEKKEIRSESDMDSTTSGASSWHFFDGMCGWKSGKPFSSLPLEVGTFTPEEILHRVLPSYWLPRSVLEKLALAEVDLADASWYIVGPEDEPLNQCVRFSTGNLIITCQESCVAEEILVLLPQFADNTSTNNFSPGVDEEFSTKRVFLDHTTTSKEVLEFIFSHQPELISSYRLVCLYHVEGVAQHHIFDSKEENTTKLWPLVCQLKKLSPRTWFRASFYLESIQEDESTAVNIVLTLPPNHEQQMTLENYENALRETLEVDCSAYTTDLVSDLDLLVLSFTSAKMAEETLLCLKSPPSAREPSPWSGVIALPQIVPDKIQHKSAQPLLVFVNLKSGEGQGDNLLRSFRNQLNPHQVCVLSSKHGGPLPYFYAFRNLKQFKILCCGGDGTVGWVLGCLERARPHLRCKAPPVAVLPLGTGNDLARVLRWGCGHTDSDDILALLEAVDVAEEVFLDRWQVQVRRLTSRSSSSRSSSHRSSSHRSSSPRSSSPSISPLLASCHVSHTFQNYFGVGVDACMALEFHVARENSPMEFNSRLYNKSVYVAAGLRQIVYTSQCTNLSRWCTLTVDGRGISLPHDLEGIVLLNIPSWAAGTPLWEDDDEGGDNSSNFSRSSYNDGLIEVVGLCGIMHVAKIVSGIRSGIRLAQGSDVKIRLTEEMPVQSDGEPWLQAPAELHISCLAYQSTLLKRRPRIDVVEGEETVEEKVDVEPSDSPASSYFEHISKWFLG